MARLGGALAVLATALAIGPSGAPASPAALTLDYRLPPRYGLDANHDGLVDSITTPAQVAPTAWTALVTVRCGRASTTLLFDTGISPDGMTTNAERLGFTDVTLSQVTP